MNISKIQPSPLQEERLRKNYMEIPWVLVYVPEISMGCNTILLNFRGRSLTQISKGKMRNLKIPGVFPKYYVLMYCIRQEFDLEFKTYKEICECIHLSVPVSKYVKKLNYLLSIHLPITSACYSAVVLVHLQTCLFINQIKQNEKLANFFSELKHYGWSVERNSLP